MTTDNPRIRNLIGDEFRIVRFADLDPAMQAAMAWYMANDGGAWSDVMNPSDLPFEEFSMNPFDLSFEEFKAVFHQYQDAFIQRHADYRFGFVTLDAEKLKECVMQDPDLVDDADTWEKAEEITMSFCMFEEVLDDTCPVFLNCDDDMTLQDGWPRLHKGIRDGKQKIEAVFFAESFDL